MRYKKGTDRRQVILFPASVDEYVAENNPVRFLDEFVNGLDLVELGFTHATPEATGRKPYNPGDLLKLYIYGYLNKTRTSRRLEKLTHQNIEVMWLLRTLKPDHKTIADFRKDNKKAFKRVFRQFVLLCQALHLFGAELVGIDGSKFSAVNHNGRHYSQAKLKKLLQQIDEQIDRYWAQLDQGDEAEVSIQELHQDELRAKINQLKDRQQELQQWQQQLEASGETQISLTDPDSRMMKHHKGSDMSYNVQMVTDAKHKLIVDVEVTNAPNDRNQLSRMALKAKEILGVEKLSVTADAGYHNEGEIAACEQAQITCYIPKPAARPLPAKDKLFTKADFHYDAKNDLYICPANKRLTYCRSVEWTERKPRKKYGCRWGRTCALRAQCLGKKRGNRYLFRGFHEAVVDEMEKRVEQHPEIIQKRKELVEHPFGTMKHWMDQGYFLMRGMEKVTAEISLTALCYNIKRVLNIVEMKKLIATLQALSARRTKTLFFPAIYGLARLISYLKYRTGIGFSLRKLEYTMEAV